MSVNIGPKIGIDGEAKYRAEINKIIQQGKTLSAQMKAVSSAYQNADDKEKALANVSKTLSDQIRNQREIVSKFADAVAKSTSQTGENSTETLKWKEQLAKAEKELNDLEGTTAETAVGIDDLGNKEEEATQKTSIFGDVLSAALLADAIKAGVNALIDGLEEIAKYFVDATKAAAAYGDEILSLSAQTSMSTQSLQEYKYMSALTDTELETITGSMTKLTKSMSSARDGTGTAADAFKELNVSVTDSSGQLRDSNAVFDDVITALGSITNETERDALAMSIFGKSAQELNPLIEAGGDALAAFREEAHETGYVLDDETLSKMGKVQDGFDRLGLAADSAKIQIGAAIGEFILPYLNELVSAVQSLVGGGDIEAFVSSISSIVNGLLGALSEALPQILTIGTQIVGDLIMGINTMLPTLVPAAVNLISQLASFIMENLPTITTTALEIVLALVSGIGENLPTLIPAAIQMIMEIVNGLVGHIGDIISAALTLIDGLVEGLTSGEAINSIINAIPTIITSLINGILNNLPQFIASGINIIINLAMGLVRAIPQIVASIPQIISAVINAFKSYNWSGIGKDIIANVSDGAKANATAMVNGAKKALEAAINWLKNLGGQALAWGKDMITGFGNGIRAAAEQVIAKVRSLADKIRGFLHFSRPDFGPLRDYEQWMPDFMKGLAKGIDQNAWRVEDALKNVSTDMSIAAALSPGVGYGSQKNTTNNYSIPITVYAQPGQDVNELADVIMQKMQSAVVRREAVFA